MRILLTGSTGLIGRNLLPLLLAKGHEVTCVVRSGAPKQLSPTHFHLTGDLLEDRFSLHGLKYDSLIHLAWLTTPGEYWTSALNEAWVDASLRLARQFLDAGGTKIIVTGTCAEYRWGNSSCDEDTGALQPQSPYGSAKAKLRNCLLDELQSYAGSSLAWARVFFPYGPGEATQRLFPQLLIPMLAGEDVRCSDGWQKRDYLHANDVAGAIATLIDNRSAVGDFNIASGQAVSIRDIVDICREVTLSNSRIVYGSIPMRVSEPDRIAGNSTKLTQLGWEPQLDLRIGIAAYSEWLRTHGF
ncbi:NAD-dependent epimerase/dehydratase family protein [Congregibacter sp.]|uniref:NAD-dependent epimerase/dehydratase family protein n=1 Tax=Congregibacter sp. TaxID=2744308 RepID=UPI0039E28E0F